MNDFFDSLSDTQKESLLIFLSEQKTSKPSKQPSVSKQKRKQARKKSSNKPVKRNTKLKNKTQHPKIPTGHNIGRRETFETKQRPNHFIKSGEFKKHKKDTTIDKKLAGDNELSERNRVTKYVAATCSKCKYEFDNVPAYECYNDDDGISFICEECGLRR